MKLVLIKKIGDGTFADVWTATDELERELAVKIIRPATVGVSNALAHAKALARAKHPNVVGVIGLERIPDPDGGELVDCVVMELLKGSTLEAVLKGPKLSRGRIGSIGKGMIDGIRHIHSQGLAHGDFHEENVMVEGDTAKVIDILYLDSLAVCGTLKREARLKRDITSLRLLLQQLIVRSEVDSAEATEFNNMLDSDSGIDDIEEAFNHVLLPSVSEDDERLLDHAYARVVEEEFVADREYALALLDETPEHLALPLLLRLAESRAYRDVHKYYVAGLWHLLSDSEKATFAQEFGPILEKDVPNGSFGVSLRMLKIIKRDGWKKISPRIRMKLEAAITKDVLAGKKDIHSFRKTEGGALGTHARSLWKNFAKPVQLADHLISLLSQNWYTQNYVGEYFLDQIPEIAEATERRSEFVKAIRSAISNDARIVVEGLDDLPQDWVDEVLQK